MIITVNDTTNSAKPLYYQSLVLLYMPCEKFGETDTENTLRIDAWQENGDNHVVVKLKAGDKYAEFCDVSKINNDKYADMKNFIGRCFIKCAAKIFGFVPPWGISTGVKPVKLARMFVNTVGSDSAYKILTQDYMINPTKARTAVQACINEDLLLQGMSDNACSLYISIPFCPTKCSYCSFVSCATPRLFSLIPQYLEKLKSELCAVSELINESGLNLQSVYVGGGTPAILSASQIEDLLECVNACFKVSGTEFTFEAGRPDCISVGKLRILKNLGVNRVSINTQTTNDLVLAEVGRNHTFKQYASAMEYAKGLGFECINTDLIAGLPGESEESFMKSVTDVASFKPENITVHALTLKKSSELRTCGVTDFEGMSNAVSMTDFASNYLAEFGYKPYYMYRQKNTVDNLDNVGYAKQGFESIYNIIMMGEYHTVFGVGAGSVTKIVSKDKSHIERIFSPKYPYEFLDSDKYAGFDKEKCIGLIKKGDSFDKK